MSASTPPHVVFLFSDQHNPQVIGRAGDTHVRTPHLDQLMDEGTSFTHTYCPSPLCVPSRMATLSGLLPSRTGVFTNYHSLRSDQATFVHSLALAGYETVLCGRMHFVGPDQRHGYSQRPVGELTPVQWGAEGPSYGVLRGTPGQGRLVLEKSGPGDSLVLHYDQDVTDGACRFLHDYKQDKPLFLTVGWYGPHCPYVCPRDLFAHYHERLPLPEIPADDAALHHPALCRHQQARDCLNVPEDWVRRARAAYWGLTEILDRHIGRVMDAIDRTLGLDNTLVIYASDHGDTIGEHGLFWKTNYYEGSVRVPLIFRAPSLLGDTSRGRRVGQLARRCFRHQPGHGQ
jgi:choline-sulfatase